MEQHKIAEVMVAGGNSSLIQHPSIHISKDSTKPREEERWGPVGRMPTLHCSDGWRLLESSHKVRHQLWLWASFSLFRWWKYTCSQCTAWKRWWMCCSGDASFTWLDSSCKPLLSESWDDRSEPLKADSSARTAPVAFLCSSMSKKVYDFGGRRSAANQPILQLNLKTVRLIDLHVIICTGTHTET